MVVLAMAGGSAWADSTTIVFPADGQAPVGFFNAAQKVTTAIEDAARSGGAEVTVSAASRADVAGQLGCEPAEAGCLQQIAEKLGVDVVVAIELSSTDDGLDVTVELASRDGSRPSRTSWAISSAESGELEAIVRRHAWILFGGDPDELDPVPDAPPVTDVDRELPPNVRGPSATRDRGGSRLGRVKLYSWLTAGAGLALVATGGVFLVDAGSKQDEIDSGPEPQTLDDFRALEELEDEAESRALWGNVLTGAGIVATGVGVTLIILQMGSEPDRGGVAVAPAVFPDGFGVTLTVVGTP